MNAINQQPAVIPWHAYTVVYGVWVRDGNDEDLERCYRSREGAETAKRDAEASGRYQARVPIRLEEM